jgi:N-acetylmuramoyl-L-alanine amidase
LKRARGATALPTLRHWRLALALAAAAAASAATAASACERGGFRIVLDVGHTAQVPGAISARGVPEYDFNLRLAGQVDAALKGAGFSGTQVLVTSGSARRGLAARVARANARPADLFLSLHHDSVPEQFLETWEHDGKPQRYSDRFGGHSLFVSLENRQAEASLRFARALGTALGNAGLRYTPHYADPIMGWRQRDLLDAEAGVYRFDELVVLRRTAMPAVLFEAGSIVNRSEELIVASSDRQRVVAGAVVAAVESFCASLPPRRPGGKRG